MSLYFLYIQPFSSKEVTGVNLNDFDLPSGLTCMGTVICIMDLYKKYTASLPQLVSQILEPYLLFFVDKIIVMGGFYVFWSEEAD